MEFKKLGNTPCDCINDKCVVNTSDIFCRRLFGESPTEKDYETWWEMGKRPNKSKLDECQEVCGYKSVSVSKFVNEEVLLAVYRKTISIKPASPKYYCKINFSDKCGKIVLSSSKNDVNHHSFYKSDEFNWNNIVVKEIKEISV